MTVSTLSVRLVADVTLTQFKSFALIYSLKFCFPPLLITFLMHPTGIVPKYQLLNPMPVLVASATPYFLLVFLRAGHVLLFLCSILIASCILQAV